MGGVSTRGAPVGPSPIFTLLQRLRPRRVSPRHSHGGLHGDAGRGDLASGEARVFLLRLQERPRAGFVQRQGRQSVRSVLGHFRYRFRPLRRVRPPPLRRAQHGGVGRLEPCVPALGLPRPGVHRSARVVPGAGGKREAEQVRCLQRRGGLKGRALHQGESGSRSVHRHPSSERTGLGRWSPALS